MKKLIVIVTLLSIFTIAAAENGFGIKGGFNLGSYRNSDSDSKFKYGAIGGFFYNIPLNDQYSIQPELLFTMKGNRFEREMNGYDDMGNYLGKDTYKSSISFSYLEIPVLAKMEINRSQTLNTIIYAGPFIGFNLDNSYKVEFFESEYEGSEDVNFIEMGFSPGVMLEFSNSFILDARYTYGITDIYDIGFNLTVISFMLGYKL